MVMAAGGAVGAGGTPYESPIKGKCNDEILKDAEWHRELGNLFKNQLFFDPRTGAVAAHPEVKLPEHEAGYTSAMRDECLAEMKKDGVWMAELRAYYDGLLSYAFQESMANSFATNKKHVIGAYAAILIFLIGFVVFMFLRQRQLVAEIDRLREDVEQAASE
jgi:hypothetical protein